MLNNAEAAKHSFTIFAFFGFSRQVFTKIAPHQLLLLDLG
jgi:hypothetical protein